MDKFVKKIWSAFRFGFMGRWILHSVLVGLVSGIGACVFFLSLEWMQFFIMGKICGIIPIPAAGEDLIQYTGLPEPRRLLFFFVPALGGLLSGLIVYTWAPEAREAGTDAMLYAFHNQGGHIRYRIPLIKLTASVLTLATGGSGGRQGPMAQIGAGIGSCVASIMHFSSRERRILMLAGCAGGLSAIFRAPLGAALISIEVLYAEDFETEAIIPCIISSVVSYLIFTSIFGEHAIFSTPDFHFHHVEELIFYALLAIICAGTGFIFVKCFYTMRNLIFRPLPIPPHFKPALGGLGVGIIGLLCPQALGVGYGWIQMALWGKLAFGSMLFIALMKILSTSMTIGSGGSGGVFGPSLFIGAMLGGFVGYMGNYFYPDIVVEPSAFVLVGMASFFAGVANAPIGALLMVTEMSGSYKLLAPLMLVSAFALIFSRRWSIYENQVRNKFFSPSHLKDMTVNVLQEITVRDILDMGRPFIRLQKNMSFDDLKKVISSTSQHYFPVVDEHDRLVGVLSLKNIRTVLFEENVKDLLVVADLFTPAPRLYPREDLYSALSKFLESGYGQLPVVADNENDRIIGILTHSDIISAYFKEISIRKSVD